MQDIKAALDAAVQNGYRYVKLKCGSEEFVAEVRPSVRKRPKPMAPVSQALDQVHSEPTLAEIKSPVVGYFRERSHPLEPGLEVEAGQVVAEVVAVGLSNDVVSPVQGVVDSVEVRPGDPLEYGQVIATVRPT